MRETGDQYHELAFVLDRPRKIQPPDLRRWTVAQGAERDGELGRPARIVHVRLHFPRAVPIDVHARPGAGRTPAASTGPSGRPASNRLTLVAHLRVVLNADRVRSEDEPVLLVVIGVENHLKRILARQRGIAPRVGRDKLRHVCVETCDADIEHGRRVQQAHLGLFRRGLAFRRLDLDEVVDGRRLLPRLLVEHSIDRGRFSSPYRRCAVRRRCRLCYRRLRSSRRLGIRSRTHQNRERRSQRREDVNFHETCSRTVIKKGAASTAAPFFRPEPEP